MSNKRKNDRKQSTFYLKVYDQKSNKMAGNLRNITSNGIMLNSPEPIATGIVYQLGVALPDALIGEIPITLEAKSIWCSRNRITKLYDTGFELLNVSSNVSLVSPIKPKT